MASGNSVGANSFLGAMRLEGLLVVVEALIWLAAFPVGGAG